MKSSVWKKFFYLSAALFPIILFSCTSSKVVSEDVESKIEEQTASAEQIQLSQMTLRQKVGQLFIIRPESIDETIDLEELHSQFGRGIKELSPSLKDFYNKYPAGGFALFGRNIETPEQITLLNEQLHNLNSIKPFLFIDEEGGLVSRIAEKKEFNVPEYKNMEEIGKTGDSSNAFEAGKTIGSYLNKYGFDVDFAPIADVNTNPKNPVIGSRAFSNIPEVAAVMDIAFLRGLHSSNTYGCLKHFPGHGDTKTDTHLGYAETTKNWNELKNCEMITFKAGIDSGVNLIMTAHIAAPEVTGNNNPATLSYTLLTEKLRNEMGYNGLIITDAMEMGAIRKKYKSSEAAIMAIKAGADLILMPFDYKEAFEGIIKAVEAGNLDESRIDESVIRILHFKNKSF